MISAYQACISLSTYPPYRLRTCPHVLYTYFRNGSFHFLSGQATYNHRIRDIRHRNVCHFNFQKNAQLLPIKIYQKRRAFQSNSDFCFFPREQSRDKAPPHPAFLTRGNGRGRKRLDARVPGRRSQSAAARFQNNKKPGHSPAVRSFCADGKRRAHASQNRQHSITIHDDSPQRIPHTAQTPPPARTDAEFSALFPFAASAFCRAGRLPLLMKNAPPSFCFVYIIARIRRFVNSFLPLAAQIFGRGRFILRKRTRCGRKPFPQAEKIFVFFRLFKFHFSIVWYPLVSKGKC